MRSEREGRVVREGLRGRWSRRLLQGAALALLVLALQLSARAEEDPFAAGTDALAVKEGDASSSVRAKLKLAKLGPEMVIVQVQRLDDARFPDCTFDARVMTAPKAAAKELKLLGRGKVYRFAPVLKRKGKQLDLTDQATQSNLGACYYPKGTTLVVKVGGVDLTTKVFSAAEVYVK